MDRLPDQRYQFRAVPFGLTQFAGDLMALPVDQQGCRHTRSDEAVRSSARGIDVDRELFDPDLQVEPLTASTPLRSIDKAMTRKSLPPSRACK